MDAKSIHIKFHLLYRKVFPVDILGLHLSNDIEALLFIYCQHQAELKPGKYWLNLLHGVCMCVRAWIHVYSYMNECMHIIL